MSFIKLECPSCGAQLSETDSKYVCEYCGKEVIMESQKIAAIGSSIARSDLKMQEVIATGSQSTQLELRKLQLTQELSMLEMQLSNLRSEKRSIGLVQKKTREHRKQVQQIENEEQNLLKRIAYIQSSLHPPVVEQAGTTVTEERVSFTPSYSYPKSQSVTFWLAAFLGVFGAHRFFTGYVKLGFLYLFTFGIMGLGYIFDLFAIFFGKYKDSKGIPLSPMGKVAKICAGIFLFLFVMGLLKAMAQSGSSPSVMQLTPTP